MWPLDDVSHCNSWQVVTKNEGSEPGHTFEQKVFYQQWKLEFLVGLVHTKNHTFFQKSINLSNLLTTEKTTPRRQGIT